MADSHDIPETLMAYLDGELSAEEAAAFEKVLEQHPEWREEAARMAELRDAADALAFKPAPEGTWDGYWEEIDSRLAKPFGWVLLAIGGVLLAGYGTVKILLLADNPWVRLGLAAVLAGFLIVFISVLRGHLLERPRDRYRRINR